MKQNTEEPDYRSMNEVQLKYELIKLEKKNLDIIGDPIDYKHYGPFLDWRRDDAKAPGLGILLLVCIGVSNNLTGPEGFEEIVHVISVIPFFSSWSMCFL